jgi:hypothetical protein
MAPLAGPVAFPLFGLTALFVVYGFLWMILHVVFRVRTSLVCLLAIALTWLFLTPFEPVAVALNFGGLAVAIYMGYRLLPRTLVAAAGFDSRAADDHAAFHVWVERTMRLRSEWQPIRPATLEAMMHHRALRMYRRAIWWALCSAAGNLFIYELA